MYIKGINSHQLDLAIRAVNDKFNAHVTTEYTTNTRKGVKAKLRVETNKSVFHRLAQSLTSLGNRKKIVSLCWHGFGHVFREVFTINPLAKIRTAQIVYKDVSAFNNNFYSTDRNIGSEIYPLLYSEACECEGEERNF